MNHIRKFSSYRNKINPVKTVSESVLQVDDTYKVRVIVDVKKSFVNSYIKKVSDNTQKNLRDFYSDMDIVEELVKHVVEGGMNVDTIPATILVGGPQGQGQGQGQSAQPAQVQTAPASDFEDVQTQDQTQPQTQVQTQDQNQPQTQVQAQGQKPQAPAPQQPQEDEEDEEELPE